MARQLFEFDVTTPAGIAKATPQITNLTMPSRIVRRITIKVPPGPNGQLGFAVGMVNTAVIPAALGTFIVTSDETIIWDVAELPDSGAWQIISYNTGQYPHTIYTRWEVDLVQDPASASSPLLIPTATILPVVAGGPAGAVDTGTTVTDAQLAADQAALDAALAGGGS